MRLSSQSPGPLCALAIELCLSPILFAAADAGNSSVAVIQVYGGTGAWMEPIAEFEAGLDAPNATGNYPIAGPNISAPYSETSNLDGWSWSVDVAADLPIGSAYTSKYGNDKFYTGGKLTFNAPASLLSSSSRNLTVNDDWEICLYSWQIGLNWGSSVAAYPNELRIDDGSCSSVLTSECITDLQNAISFGQCSCPPFRDIPSCVALGEDTAPWRTTCVASRFNATRIRQWEDGKLVTWAYGGATVHDRGNLTDYNDVGSLAWPVMASFGSSQTATLSCLRASNATQGSTAPDGKSFQNGTGDQESSGSRIWLNGFWLTPAIILASRAFNL